MVTKDRWWRREDGLVGVNYHQPDVVARYDDNTRHFRNAEQEWQLICQSLGLNAESTVIDMGTGTGTFALHAAHLCRQVYAVDVSAAMLERVRQGALASGLGNVECHQAGLLSYDHCGSPVDAVVCQSVLHHVPDFWKMVALLKMSQMLKSEGLLYLMDVVFSFEPKAYECAISREIEDFSRLVGNSAAEEYAGHFRDEYSTFDWVMEGILERTGYDVVTAEYRNKFVASYVCKRRRCA